MTQIAELLHRSLIGMKVLWIERRNRDIPISAFPLGIVFDLNIKSALYPLFFYVNCDRSSHKGDSDVILALSCRDPMIVELHIDGHMFVMQARPQKIVVILINLVLQLSPHVLVLINKVDDFEDVLDIRIGNIRRVYSSQLESRSIVVKCNRHRIQELIAVESIVHDQFLGNDYLKTQPFH